MRQVGLISQTSLRNLLAVRLCSLGGEYSINRSLRGLEKKTTIILIDLCVLQQAQDYVQYVKH